MSEVVISGTNIRTGEKRELNLDGTGCVICMEDWQGRQIGVLPLCDHKFCYDCITQITEDWYTGRKPCPLCRQPFDEGQVQRYSHDAASAVLSPVNADDAPAVAVPVSSERQARLLLIKCVALGALFGLSIFNRMCINLMGLMPTVCLFAFLFFIVDFADESILDISFDSIFPDDDSIFSDDIFA